MCYSIKIGRRKASVGQSHDCHVFFILQIIADYDSFVNIYTKELLIGLLVINIVKYTLSV